MKAHGYFYYINWHFPTDNNLITLPKPKTPDFIQADEEISTIALYEQFRGGKSHALVYAQFLCTFNIHLQDDPKLSCDAMREFYHNLLMQVVIKSNSELLLDFDMISELVMNIKYLLQKQTYAFRREKQQVRNAAFEIYDSVDYAKA